MFNTCVKLRNDLAKVKILIYHSSTKLFDIAIKLDTMENKKSTYFVMKHLIYMSIVRVGHINRL